MTLVIDAHSEEKVSLRIDNPFPALLQKSTSIDLVSLDQTTHAHVPYVYILIQAAAQWRAKNNGALPKTFAERKAFQRFIEEMKMKIDEENFDEASAQWYRVNPQPIPSGILQLFEDPVINTPGALTVQSKPFFHLLAALKEYVTTQEQDKWTLPLSANLPDMHSDTNSYVEIQTLYKNQAREERERFKSVLVKQIKALAGSNANMDEIALLQSVGINEGLIDDFVKNSHGLKVLRSTKYGSIDSDKGVLGICLSYHHFIIQYLTLFLTESSLSGKTRETTVHLAFAALDSLPAGTQPTSDNLNARVTQILPESSQFNEEIQNYTGEM